MIEVIKIVMNMGCPERIGCSIYQIVSHITTDQETHLSRKHRRPIHKQTQHTKQIENESILSVHCKLLNCPHRLVLPMLYVSMFHIPRLSGILTSLTRNIFVVNLGIKFVPEVLIQFFIAIVLPNSHMYRRK